MSSQRGSVFLASALTVGVAEREHEKQDMRTAWFTRAELEAMIAAGEVTDAHSLAANTLLLLHDRRG